MGAERTVGAPTSDLPGTMDAYFRLGSMPVSGLIKKTRKKRAARSAYSSLRVK